LASVEAVEAGLKRSSHIFDAGSLLLTHLLFIRVAEDDDLAIAERPKDNAVELAKEHLGEFKVTRSSNDKILLI
jgi:hypothetical protein